MPANIRLKFAQRHCAPLLAYLRRNFYATNTIPNSVPVCDDGTNTLSSSIPMPVPSSTSDSTSTEEYALEKQSIPSDTRPRLVIIGTGWAGYALLRNVDRRKFHVSVISNRNHFLFTPLLASTSVGTLEFRSIQEPIRNLNLSEMNDFHLGNVIEIDAKKKEIYCQSALDPGYPRYKVEYNILAIAVGMRSNSFGIDGVNKYAHFLKELSDARKIRNHLIKNLELSCEPGISAEEQKRLLTIVIAGGGATGVEFGSEVYDFLIQDAGRLYKDIASNVQVLIVEPNQILSNFDAGLRLFTSKKISQRQNMRIVEKFIVDVQEKHIVFKDGTTLPFGLLVWATGLAPSDLVKQTKKLPKSERNQILTNSHLEVLGFPNVYALGDCATIETGALPATAQVAERQGKYLAKCLNARANPAFANQETQSFSFKSLGMLAYVGDYKAVSDLSHFKLRGIISFILWRSSYLTSLGSWKSRLQVPFDWMKTFFFGRDVSRF